MMNRIYKYFCSLAIGCFAASATATTILPSADTIMVSDVDLQSAAQTTDVTPTEGMLHNVDTQVDGWYMRKYMRVDSTLYTNENPIFPREVYMDRLRRLPNIVEMPYNDVVQDYINHYTGRLRRSVSFMLGVQNFYVPLFEEALEAEGVPLELKYLPVVESAFDPMATSHVGAAGLWQFMVPTAKHYGMTVNSLIDERRDPIKSSRAAAKYLKDLYNSFGDWTLAIAAYNCGRNNVLKAIKRAGGARDYWAIYPYLPRETRGLRAGFHRGELRDDLLLRPQNSGDEDDRAGRNRHGGGDAQSSPWTGGGGLQLRLRNGAGHEPAISHGRGARQLAALCAEIAHDGDRSFLATR